jgi:hypothetical protein
MSREKKIGVEFIKRVANEVLSSPRTDASERSIVCDLVESILFEAKAYKGYMYLEWNDAETDQTRRLYY